MSRLHLRAISLCLLVILTFVGCNRAGAATGLQAPTALPTPAASPPIKQSTATYASSPLTGLDVETGFLTGRPVAVMIDNAPTARPHYGLSRADLLYEMLVEGGLTRIMAVFQSRQSELIGPVRSVRPAFIEKVMELDAVLVHCGGSEEALQSIPALGIPDIDEIDWTAPFWRDPKRSAPHDLFTSSANLARAVASRKSFAGSLDQSVFTFGEDPSTGKPATEISIKYPGGYVVSYRYDNQTKLFQRLINGQPHVDAENGQALTVANLVIEVVSVKVLDSEGRLRFDSVGRGEAYIMTQGTLRRGHWVKDSSQALTRLVDDQGREIALARGVTCIQQVTPATPVEIR